MASSTSERTTSAEPPTGLTGWPWRAVLAVLVVGAALDLLLTLGGGSPSGPMVLALVTAVPYIVVRGLRVGGRLFTAAGRASALSFCGSVGLGIAGAVDERWAATDFGLAEGAALTLVLVACFRQAVGRQHLVTVAVALAVLALPLRLGWSSDVVAILLAALAVGAVAAATGSALRAADARHRYAISAMRRTEREGVARELHDIVAHHVTGMVVLTQAARAIIDDPLVLGDPPRAGRGAIADPRLGDALASVEATGAEALSSLRSMVAVLRSSDPDGEGSPLGPVPGAADLVEVVRHFRDSGTAARVDLSVERPAPALSAPVLAAVHRVVQESLTNAARYARGAEWVRVRLASDRSIAVVTVQDSGGRGEKTAGSDQASWGGGFGIVGMRERVEVLGGSLEAGPEPGGGWTVRAQVPL